MAEATATPATTNTNTTTTATHSPSNSQSSSTNPPPPFLSPQLPPSSSHSLKEEVKDEEQLLREEDTAMDTGVSDHPPEIHDGFQDFTAEEILKFQKYEADYACRLRAKYFSNKDIYGGDIFEVIVPVGNEIIKASRWPPTQSYADPKQSFIDRSSIEASGAETSPIVSNGNTTPPKSSS